MTAELRRPIEIFYSYAHEDEALRKELEKHLSLMKRQGQITGWHDRKIEPGTEWAGEIDNHLNTAQIILLLVSADFIASDYCYSVEMKRALERHDAKEARVIPVILRPVAWKGAPFGKLLSLPSDSKPVTRWADRDEAFVDITEGIQKAVKELLKEQWSDEGNAHLKANRYVEALDAFEQALQLDPDYTPAYNGKGDALYWLKRYEEALTAYQEAIRLDPDNASAYKGKGKALGGLNRYQEALAAIEQFIRLNPNDPDAYNFKGSSLAELGRYEEALVTFDKAIRLDPNDALGYYFKGLALAKLQRLQEVISIYEQIISLEPSNASAYVFKGDALYNLKRYEEALTAYEHAIRLTPDDPSVHNGKGLSLLNLSRYEEALEAFEQATRLDPNFARSYHNKGLVHERLAQQAYEKARQLGYSDERLTKHVARTESDRANVYSSKLSTRTHLNTSGIVQKTKDQWLQEGNTCFKAAQYDMALAAYEEVIRLDPDYALAYNNKSRVLNALGRYEEALIILEQALQLSPNDYIAALVHHNKSWALLELKRYEEALAASEQAIGLTPDNSIAASSYHNKYLTLKSLGKLNEAEQAREKAHELGFIA